MDLILNDREGRPALSFRAGPGGLVVSTLSRIEHESHRFIHLPFVELSRLAAESEAGEFKFESFGDDCMLKITVSKAYGGVTLKHELHKGSNALHSWCDTMAERLMELLNSLREGLCTVN